MIITHEQLYKKKTKKKKKKKKRTPLFIDTVVLTSSRLYDDLYFFTCLYVCVCVCVCVCDWEKKILNHIHHKKVCQTIRENDSRNSREILMRTRLEQIRLDMSHFIEYYTNNRRVCLEFRIIRSSTKTAEQSSPINST